MLSKAEAKRLQGLARARARSESGLFLAEGVRVVEDLLDSPIVPRLAVISTSLEDTDRGAALAARLRQHVRTETVPDHELRRLADTESPQGVVVAAEIPRPQLEALVLPEDALIVVLDAVQDPGNFGTIVRSADAFGATAVCTLAGTVDPWNPKAVRGAAGSSLRVPVIETDGATLLPFLEGAGFRILGADMGGADIGGVVAGARTALVLGNEGAGIGVELRAHLDGTVAVPIRGSAESLNVGVAAGILLYMLSRES
ncbi:MAG TPA: RNA methyltransferase [Longimicrobiales bacterium]|nr:RNA methyltransferase [Longimicrobiales bacterium]